MGQFDEFARGEISSLDRQPHQLEADENRRKPYENRDGNRAQTVGNDCISDENNGISIKRVLDIHSSIINVWFSWHVQ